MDNNALDIARAALARIRGPVGDMPAEDVMRGLIVSGAISKQQITSFAFECIRHAFEGIGDMPGLVLLDAKIRYEADDWGEEPLPPTETELHNLARHAIRDAEPSWDALKIEREVIIDWLRRPFSVSLSREGAALNMVKICRDILRTYNAKSMLAICDQDDSLALKQLAILMKILGYQQGELCPHAVN